MNALKIITVFLVFLLAGCGNEKPADHITTTTAAPAQLMTLRNGGIPEDVNLPAQLSPYQAVSLFPKVNGYVRSVGVDIGSKVKKGQLLMTLEAPELVQAALQAKEKAAQANLQYTIEKENYNRLQQAAHTIGAVSPMQLAQSRAKALADSTVWNAEKANWEIQQTMLSYLIVTAPFNGVITQRNIHPGALVGGGLKDGKPMLEIQQVNRLRLQTEIPERIVATLPENAKVSFYLNAFPGKKMEGILTRRSGVVSSADRSERTEIDVYNPSGKLAPGMFGQVHFQSSGNPESFNLPKTAVVTSTERKYVLLVRNGKTIKSDVSTGNESVDSVEVSGMLQPGDRVLTTANDEMKEGVAINQISTK